MNEEIITRLQDPDPDERRRAAEELLTAELTEDIIKALASLLEDPDKGVIDAVSFTLAYNGHPKIPYEVVPYVSSPNIIVRNLAGDILLKIGAPAIPAMVDYIDVGNDDDKKFVIDLLGLMEDTSSIPKILQVMAENKNDNVILACIEAIGHLKYPGALNEIIALYHSNELFKPTCIEALGNIGTDETLSFMLQQYNNEDELTKFSIIESLGLVGNEETFFFLLAELRKTEGPLKWPIIESIWKLKERYQLDIPFDESIKNSILSTLLEAEMKYKIPAAHLIVVFDDKDILDALIKVFGLDFELDSIIKPKLIDNARIVFPKIAEILKERPKNTKNLLEFIKEVTDMVGVENIRTLTPIEYRNLVDAITTCVDHPNEEARKTTLELLFTLEPDTALLFLDNFATDDDIWNRMKLLEIIETYDDPRVIQALNILAQDSDDMIRERAQWLLSQKNN
ncbi:MAG TPA: HEAT repeat domain-containing protein [Ignavibacteriales bacterium]|mgnify:CR=1 FL=1|nr:HEAT repeat domain-containing protein [Ignavibacteriales bacterium]